MSPLFDAELSLKRVTDNGVCFTMLLLCLVCLVDLYDLFNHILWVRYMSLSFWSLYDDADTTAN